MEFKITLREGQSKREQAQRIRIRFHPYIVDVLTQNQVSPMWYVPTTTAKVSRVAMKRVSVVVAAPIRFVF
jgi:hypothetical protein